MQPASTTTSSASGLGEDVRSSSNRDSVSTRVNKGKSARIDIPSEYLPPLAPPQGAGGDNAASHLSFSSKDARRSLAANTNGTRASGRVGVVNPYLDAEPLAVAVADNGEAASMGETEVFYVDDETGKATVRKSMMHKGRPAEVVMEINAEGQPTNVISGTAQLPGESKREYFRQMSSFARWQLHDTPGTSGISWDGDQRYAYFSYLVIIVTGVMLCVEIGINRGIEPFAINPTLGPRREVLLQLGAKKTDLIQNGEFHRLIAPWWLHGGILHWVINMVALINLGFSLEKEFGTPKIAIVFCACGFMGVLCSAVFVPQVVGVGASGAIFGLFGSCFADLIQNWGLYKSRGNARSVLCQLIFGAILNFLLGFLPMLDQFAHMGGFFAGISLGFVLLVQKRYTRFGELKTVKLKQRLLQIAGAVTFIIATIILLILLYTQVDPDGWCDFCSVLNCIPIQGLWNCDDTGCSDDPLVQGLPFPNSTMQVTCPSSTNGKLVYVPIDAPPTPEDVAQACRNFCFI